MHNLKRRNIPGDPYKRRNLKPRHKFADSVYNSAVLYGKFIMIWALVLCIDHVIDFRLEYLCPFWFLLTSLMDSFKYQGLVFSFVFLVVAIASDVLCYLIVPVQLLFFTAATYVWAQYLWYIGIAERGVCVPTVALCALIIYVEASVRLRSFKSLPSHLDLSRPFAAHCIGYPVVSLGFGFKTLVSYKLRARKQREIQKENELYYQIIAEALPPECRAHAHHGSPVANGSVARDDEVGGDGNLMASLQHVDELGVIPALHDHASPHSYLSPSPNRSVIGSLAANAWYIFVSALRMAASGCAPGAAAATNGLVAASGLLEPYPPSHASSQQHANTHQQAANAFYASQYDDDDDSRQMRSSSRRYSESSDASSQNQPRSDSPSSSRLHTSRSNANTSQWVASLAGGGGGAPSSNGGVSSGLTSGSPLTQPHQSLSSPLQNSSAPGSAGAGGAYTPSAGGSFTANGGVNVGEMQLAASASGNQINLTSGGSKKKARDGTPTDSRMRADTSGSGGVQTTSGLGQQQPQQKDRLARLEADVRKWRSEASILRNSENKLRGTISSLQIDLAQQRTELHTTKSECEQYRSKLQTASLARSQEQKNANKLDKQLDSEKKVKVKLEQELANERKLRKQQTDELNKCMALLAATQKDANASSKSGECLNEECMQHRIDARSQTMQLRNEVDQAEERIHRVNNEKEKILKARDTHTHEAEMLLSALRVMQDKNKHLEASLSAENRVKLDLLTALSNADRKYDALQARAKVWEQQVLTMSAAYERHTTSPLNLGAASGGMTQTQATLPVMDGVVQSAMGSLFFDSSGQPFNATAGGGSYMNGGVVGGGPVVNGQTPVASQHHDLDAANVMATQLMNGDVAVSANGAASGAGGSVAGGVPASTGSVLSSIDFPEFSAAVSNSNAPSSVAN